MGPETERSRDCESLCVVAYPKIGHTIYLFRAYTGFPAAENGPMSGEFFAAA